MLKTKNSKSKSWNLAKYILKEKDVKMKDIVVKSNKIGADYKSVVCMLKNKNIITKTLDGYSVNNQWRNWYAR